jgi:hypothetical protein
MPSLADIRDRVEETLKDTGNAIWDTDAIDEAITKALERYSEVLPLEMETVVDVLSDGREIALNEVTGLIDVSEAWWPYDTTEEEWPPSPVSFVVYWDDARPVLFLNKLTGSEPQEDDEIRIWYTKLQTIDGLDSASVTTVPDHHISGLVDGAAGYAAMDRSSEQINDTDSDVYRAQLMGYWAGGKIKAFNTWLAMLRASSMGGGMPQKGWGSV